jgi:sialic acid synthase SpsE
MRSNSKRFKRNCLLFPPLPRRLIRNKTVPTKTQFAMLKSLELSFKDFEKIFRHCEKTGILFLSTPFDLESAHVFSRHPRRRGFQDRIR